MLRRTIFAVFVCFLLIGCTNTGKAPGETAMKFTHPDAMNGKAVSPSDAVPFTHKGFYS